MLQRQSFKIGKYDIEEKYLRNIALSNDTLARALLGDTEAMDLIELAVTGSVKESYFDRIKNWFITAKPEGK